MRDIITPTLAAERIEIAAANGRLRQSTWHEGEHLACLLGSIDASVYDTGSECLAHVAPRWLLDWTVPAFDRLDASRVVDAARLYAQMLRDGERLTPEQWDRVSVEFRCWLIEPALSSARPAGDVQDYWPAVEAACTGMIAALRSGDADKIEEAEAVAVAAEAAAWEAPEAARAAAAAAAAAGAVGAAGAAARAAAAAALAAEAAEAAAWEAPEAARAAAAARYRQFEAIARIVREVR